MKHFTLITRPSLVASSDDSAEYPLSDWVADDDRWLTIYFQIRAADHSDCLPFVTVIGATVEAERGFFGCLDRAGLVALLGEPRVAMIEDTQSEARA